ncbi:phage holin family protein [Lacrimispora sp.]|uniref:phage holin family protein n=1 Tax=Lacrimispora sp. TaxID=2719234 RepID=UPI0028974F65|nr:phage holin family protein [Lacrimispora sp.]
MDKKKFEVGITGIIGTWIMDKYSLLFPAIILLMILMVIDYISGMLAAKKEAIEHPNNKRYGWSSKKSIIGIYKKVSYILIILVSISTDFMLHKFAGEIGVNYKYTSIFTLLVSVWLIINELLSILENAGRMGAKLPNFLKKILTELQNDIDNKSRF